MKPSTITMEYVPTERLVGYVRNPRRNDEVVDRMMASIREYGFTIPILDTRWHDRRRTLATEGGQEIGALRSAPSSFVKAGPKRR